MSYGPWKLENDQQKKCFLFFLFYNSHLLDSDKDGIEVSYNSAGVFSHMMADGPEAWIVESPSRDEVTEKLISAIERWSLKSSRNINYRFV